MRSPTTRTYLYKEYQLQRKTASIAVSIARTAEIHGLTVSNVADQLGFDPDEDVVKRAREVFQELNA